MYLPYDVAVLYWGYLVQWYVKVLVKVTKTNSSSRRKFSNISSLFSLRLPPPKIFDLYSVLNPYTVCQIFDLLFNLYEKRKKLSSSNIWNTLLWLNSTRPSTTRLRKRFVCESFSDNYYFFAHSTNLNLRPNILIQIYYQYLCIISSFYIKIW